MLILTIIFVAGPATALTEVSGGVGSEGSGQFSSSGICLASAAGGDPSVTLGLTSSSSINNGGTLSDTKTGSQNVSLTIGGFQLSVSYDGLVQSSLAGLGTGAVTSFVGATATALSTGKDSYDIFGSADISTEGYMSGSGQAAASASGTASYGVINTATPSEAWGEVEGSSTLNMVGRASDSFLSTAGMNNGLHSESRARKSISGSVSGTDSESSYSSLTSYGSVIGAGKVNLTTSGTAQGGAWGPNFSGTKTRLVNENAQTYARGDMQGYAEANAALDAADVSALLQSYASKDSGQEISGGPATYASVTQISDASRTYAECWIDNSLQGSVVRETGRQSLQWGNLEEIRSG
ncbi:MAG TPA: hypothetical protein PLQ01_06635, partial [Methanothrix sp.]|nr:hypothetical protein [Methanothrix sp.]